MRRVQKARATAALRTPCCGGATAFARRHRPDASRRGVTCRAIGKLQVVFVSTEVAPWSKTGGLGDVVAALPAALASRGHQVMTVAPRYADYPGVYDTGLLAPVEVPPAEPPLAALHLQHPRPQPLLGGSPTPRPASPALLGGDAGAGPPGGGSGAPVRGPSRATAAGTWAPPTAGTPAILTYAAEAPAQHARHPETAAAGAAAAAEPALVTPTPQVPAPSPPEPSPATHVSYARLYACQERGVLRVFVDHPVFRPPGGGSDGGGGGGSSDGEGGGRGGGMAVHGRGVSRDQVISDMSAPPHVYGNPSFGVYTYSEGVGEADLQARNSVLCQAALAAPVLLWDDVGGMPEQLQADIAHLEGAAACPSVVLPYVLANGLARPMATTAPPVAGAQAAAGGLLASKARRGSLPPLARGGGLGSGDAQGEAQELVFVGNDWPTALLPLWLHAYRDVAASAAYWTAAVKARLQGTGSPAGSSQRWPSAREADEADQSAAPEPRVLDEAAAAEADAQRAAAEPAAAAARQPVAAAAAVAAADEAVHGASDHSFMAQHVAAAAAGPTAAALASADAGVVVGAAPAPPVPTGAAAPRRPAVWPSASRAPHDPPSSWGAGAPAAAEVQAAPPVASVSTVVLEPQPPANEAVAWDAGARIGSDDAGDGGDQWYGAADGGSVWPPPAVSQGVMAYGATAAAVPQTAVSGAPAAGAATSSLPAIGASADDAVPGALPAAASRQAAPIANTPGSPAAAIAAGEAATSIVSANGAVDGVAVPGALPAVKPAAASRPSAPIAKTSGSPAAAMEADERAVQESLLRQLLASLLGITAAGAAAPGERLVQPVARADEATAASASLLPPLPAEQQPAAADAPEEASLRRAGVVDPQRRMRGTLTSFRRFVAGRLRRAKVVFTLHNAGFQGRFPDRTFPGLGLPMRALQQMLLGGGAAPQPPQPPADAVEAAAAASSGAAPPAPALPVGGPAREVSWLRAALLASDALVTVSPTHAEELSGQGAGAEADAAAPAPGLPAAGGAELRAIIAARGVRGVLNGLDASAWDPAADLLLSPSVRYGPDDAARGKAAAKAELQAALGLEPDPAAPLFAFVGRLDLQKGVDVLLAALPGLLGPGHEEGKRNPSLAYDALAARAAAQDAAATATARGSVARRLPPAVLRLLGLPQARPAREQEQQALEAGAQAAQPQVPQASSASACGRAQVVMLGAGERWMADGLSSLRSAYPGRAAGVVGLDEPLAHLLMAGADFLVVPSRWEPCGLVALAALRYGTVPLVAPTGGLLDVVRLGGGGDAEGGPLGVVMDAPVGAADDSAQVRAAVAALQRAVAAAVELHSRNGGADLAALRRRCMEADVSWAGSAETWERLLRQVAEGGDTGAPGARQ